MIGGLRGLNTAMIGGLKILPGLGGLNTARIGGLKILPGLGGEGVKLILAMPVFSDHFIR